MNKAIFAAAAAVMIGSPNAAWAESVSKPGLVVLQLVSGSLNNGCANNFGFTRVSAKGLPLGAFKIPEGDAFLITDVDWQYVSPSASAAAGQVQTVRLWSVPAPQPGVIVLESAITLSSAGQGGANTSTVSPAAVDGPASLCVDISPGPFSGGGGVQSMFIRGELIVGTKP